MGCATSTLIDFPGITRTISEYNASNPTDPPPPPTGHTNLRLHKTTTIITTKGNSITCKKGFLIHGVVGTGHSGTVYLGGENDTMFALKEIETKDHDEMRDNKEADFLKRCVGHPCIVQYKGSFDSTDDNLHPNQVRKRMMCIVTEYVHGTSWGVSSLPQRKGPIPGTTESYSTLRGILRDVLSAVHYIHDVLHLAHMDIKPENIIVL
eukprot:PhF_6_TR22325/c1_g1_i5/m.31608